MALTARASEGVFAQHGFANTSKRLSFFVYFKVLQLLLQFIYSPLSCRKIPEKAEELLLTFF